MEGVLRREEVVLSMDEWRCLKALVVERAKRRHKDLMARVMDVTRDSRKKEMRDE